jgi:transposase
VSATSSHPTVPHSTYSDAEIIEQLKQKLQYAELKIRVLEERLRLQRIAKYGPGSEKLSDAQLQLLELEPGVSRAEVEAESQREALPSSPKTKRKHPGRQSLPSDLPRIERVIACAPEQCVCGGCGADTTVIGYEESAQLDVEPAKYFVLVTKREKRACKRCEERGVMAAPLPPRIIEKSLVSDRIVIDTVVDKYASHLPLYRQSAILKRDTGLELSRATLDGWVMRVGELLTPIVGVMRRELLAGTYIQADETPVDVQMRDGRSKNHQAYLLAVRGARRRGDLRLPHGTRARRTEAVSQTVRRHSANRWLRGLRSCRWSARGACRMLGARQKRLLRGGATESRGRRGNPDRGADR